MEEKREVNFLGFFQLFIFWLKDFWAYLDFLLSPKDKIDEKKKSASIPDGLPEVKCFQDYYYENQLELLTAKIADLFFRWPVFNLFLYFTLLRRISPMGFLPVAIFSPRIIFTFFLWLIEMIKVLYTRFLAPLTRAPALRSLPTGAFAYNAKMSKPQMFDILKEFLKLLIQKSFWFFVSLILLGIVISLLFAEGFFWYYFFTGGLSPFSEPTRPDVQYFTVQSLPIIGMLPSPLYLETNAWILLLIPIATLFLFVSSIWDKLEKMKLDQLPIFEFFEIIIHRKGKGMNKCIMAWAALLTILTEVFFAYKIIFKYVSERSFITRSPFILQAMVSLIVALFVPVIFTSFEVYAFGGMYRIWKMKIISEQS